MTKFAEGTTVTELADLHRRALLVPTIFSEPDDVTVELVIPEWFRVELDRIAKVS